MALESGGKDELGNKFDLLKLMSVFFSFLCIGNCFLKL